MAKLSNEAKTGIAVLASLLLLTAVLFKTGDLSLAQKGYFIKTQFADASGVKKFAPVCLAGIEVGEVRDIVFKHDESRTWVELELWLESRAKIRDDSEAVISTLGLMGEKYVEIRSGNSPEFLKAGGAIASKEPVDMSRLIEKVGGLADEAKLALEDFRKMNQHLDVILVDTQPKLSRILTNVDGILDVNRPRIDGILGNLDGLLENNRPKIDHILTNLEDTSEYFKEFSEDIKHHPWKVLAKGKEKSRAEIELLREERAAKKSEQKTSASVEDPSAAQAPPSPPSKKNKGFLLFGK